MYYDMLQRHKGSLLLKRIFDIIAAGILLLILLSPVLLVLSSLDKDRLKGTGVLSTGESDTVWEDHSGFLSFEPWSIMRIRWVLR